MAKKTKILMVDDDKMLLDMYKERLELAGYQVETSTNGEECLVKIHEVKPDIVLLDIMMPKVNGYDTLASIKSDPATKDTPVIILSALVRDINKSRAIEAGADDYIIKSEVMPADVIKKIENVLVKYHKDAGLPPTAPTAASPPKELPKDEPKPESPGPPPAAASTPKPPSSPPPAKAPSPPSPPAASTSPPQEEESATQDIQFEPAAPDEDASSFFSAPEKTNKKSSPIVLFFLVLIVLLILASDIFFYLRFVAQK